MAECGDATSRQPSLFPDGHELRAQALSALRDLDLARGRRLLARVRAHSPRLVNLDVLGEALALLGAVLGEAPPDQARIADVVLATREEALAGRISRAAAQLVDEVVAGFWRRRGSAAPFVDPERRVHAGVLLLVHGQAARARALLEESLRGGFAARADLWGYLGAAAHRLERLPEANACYVRALLLDPHALDLLRVHDRRLAALEQELRRLCPAGGARERLLIEGWLEQVLDVPPENGWLDAAQLARLAAVTAATAASPAPARWRRFALLLHLDRSQPSGRVDVARREEMAMLDRALFARYMDGCRARERAG